MVLFLDLVDKLRDFVYIKSVEPPLESGGSSVRVTQIHFNHDGHCTNHALNISGDPGSFLEPPEWRADNPPSPAAYAKGAIRGDITIKVAFTEGPSEDFRQISAKAASEARAFCSDEGWSKSNGFEARDILNDVAEKTVHFDSNGMSGLEEFRLPCHSIPTVPIGRYVQYWQWRYCSPSGEWRDIEVTCHPLYVTMAVPTEPWGQTVTLDPIRDLKLPWVGALDVACTWSRGARTTEEAAALITEALNSSPQLFYTSSSSFEFDDKFLLSCFIDQLSSGRPFGVNCSDCAQAVSTLANLLGCDLCQGKFETVDTNRVLKIGQADIDSNWRCTSFSEHEVAWLHNVGPDSLVYDACLKVDINSDDRFKRPLAKLPAGMPFSLCGPDGYRRRLFRNDSFVIDPASLRREIR